MDERKIIYKIIKCKRNSNITLALAVILTLLSIIKMMIPFDNEILAFLNKHFILYFALFLIIGLVYFYYIMKEINCRALYKKEIIPKYLSRHFIDLTYSNDWLEGNKILSYQIKKPYFNVIDKYFVGIYNQKQISVYDLAYNNRDGTYFVGILCSYDFYKETNEKIYVVDKMFYNYDNKLKDNVTISDETFNKNYIIYSEDENLARQFLTSDIIDIINRIKSLSKYSFEVIFCSNKMLVILKTPAGFLELDKYKNYEQTIEMINDQIKLFKGISDCIIDCNR